MVYMYHSFLIHSSADGHLGCFHVLAMINSAAMNIGVHVSLSDLVSLVCMPRSGIAGSYGSSIEFGFLNPWDREKQMRKLSKLMNAFSTIRPLLRGSTYLERCLGTCITQSNYCVSQQSCRSQNLGERKSLFGEVWVLVAQSCLTLCDPMDCSLPGSSVHGILQARTLGWVRVVHDWATELNWTELKRTRSHMLQPRPSAAK